MNDIAGAGSSVMTEHMARRRIAAAVHELRRLRPLAKLYGSDCTPIIAAERNALNEALHTLTGFTLDELREVVG